MVNVSCTTRLATARSRLLPAAGCTVAWPNGLKDSAATGLLKGLMYSALVGPTVPCPCRPGQAIEATWPVRHAAFSCQVSYTSSRMQ